IVIAAAGGRTLVFFGDVSGQVYALDAANGQPVWQLRVDANPVAMVTGTPAYHDGRLYVPVASYEEAASISPGYVCCTFRGSVLAVDAVLGKILWKTFTIAETPKPRKPTKRGVATIGPRAPRSGPHLRRLGWGAALRRALRQRHIAIAPAGLDRNQARTRPGARRRNVRISGGQRRASVDDT